jgi:hypothetical protein
MRRGEPHQNLREENQRSAGAIRHPEPVEPAERQPAPPIALSGIAGKAVG